VKKEEIERKIAERAYFYFAERGYVHGHDFEDWIRAEKEILEELNSTKRKKSGSTTRKRTTSSRKRTTKAKSTKTQNTSRRTRTKSK